MRTAAKIIYPIYVLIVFSLSDGALADQGAFKRAYQNYQDAVDKKDWASALSSAGEALHEGLAVFDKSGQNVANLRYNYARELNRSGQPREAAEQLRLCLAANEKMHGADSDALLNVLMELGKTVAASDNRAAENYFQRAITIVGRQQQDTLAAKLKLEAGLVLVRENDLAPAKAYLEDAHKFYLGRVGPKDGRTGLAALNLGKIYAENRQNGEARMVLSGALKAFTGSDPISRQFDIGARRLLVGVLESMGLHDEATPHCVAIALANAADGSAQPELLYRADTVPPPMLGTRESGGKEVEGAGGVVAVEYTVDERGMPVDVSVTSSNNSSLNDAAIKSVQHLRYAPAVAKGKPVATPGVHYRYNDKSSINIRVDH